MELKERHRVLLRLLAMEGPRSAKALWERQKGAYALGSVRTQLSQLKAMGLIGNMKEVWYVRR